ncbi:hypothetical protein [Balneola sp. MJW-20]|uniref:hypothetical protein n=1 Tax=Gracilimonas aurantiaca TaxID=3234185 RepID=UPI00390C73C8
MIQTAADCVFGGDSQKMAVIKGFDKATLTVGQSKHYRLRDHFQITKDNSCDDQPAQKLAPTHYNYLVNNDAVIEANFTGGTDSEYGPLYIGSGTVLQISAVNPGNSIIKLSTYWNPTGSGAFDSLSVNIDVEVKNED